METTTPGALARRVPSPWPWSVTMPPVDALRPAARSARQYVRDVLGQWRLDDYADAAEEIIGELVANAVNASADAESGALLTRDGKPLTLVSCLRTDGLRVRVEVWDEAPGIPAPRSASAWDTSGRGLAMVDALSEHNWGWYPPCGSPWKCVWADLGPARPSGEDAGLAENQKKKKGNIMNATQCSCGFTELSDESIIDHLEEVFTPADLTGNDGQVHEEREILQCACGWAAHSGDEFDEHLLKAFTPPNAIGKDGKRHEVLAAS
jgi:hypothetical protein